MRFFLLGVWRHNSGPCNVNRALVNNSDSSMIHIKWKRFTRIERLFKIFFCRTIVISGGATSEELSLMKLMHKRVIYLMHGYRQYENRINNLNLSKIELENEHQALTISKTILCVSERYSKWLKEQLPQFSNKISYLNNGVTIKRRKRVDKEPFSIAVSGGNRSIKNNGDVCKAVDLLIKKGYDIKLYVFGDFYECNDDILDYGFVKIMGQMDHNSYLTELDKISLFVLNSELEPFGLVVADAIDCNCSLLMSECVGAASIMYTQEEDTIYNQHDINELSNKILYLLNNDNSDRLYSSIDVDDVSEKSAYLKLKNICANL